MAYAVRLKGFDHYNTSIEDTLPSEPSERSQNMDCSADGRLVRSLTAFKLPLAAGSV